MFISSQRLRALKILVSAVSCSQLLERSAKNSLIISLKSNSEIKVIAESIAKNFSNSQLIRQLNISPSNNNVDFLWNLHIKANKIYFQNQEIGSLKILFKSTLPGELQARLSTESIIERYLEYLQKVYKIAVLNESDRHVELFIPNQSIPDFTELWKKFLQEVAFSEYGLPRYELSGLMQTFVAMLKSITLSGRGFSALEIPVINQSQANMLAAWYFAVWRDAKQRQSDRQNKIDILYKELETQELSEKDQKSKTKEIADKEAMQAKEAAKYQELFSKSFQKMLEEQKNLNQDLKSIESQLQQDNLAKKDRNKLVKQKEKVIEKLIFSEDFVNQKQLLLEESGGVPFIFIKEDLKKSPESFRQIKAIAKGFTKTATDQINGTRGDIFAKCLIEMYRLLELKEDQFDQLPAPVLTEEIVTPRSRSPGDDHKEFCYSCGIDLDPKTAKWQVLRFMFERPSQRRQSASGEGRPHICDSCALLAFASPLKVTDESIILKLEAADNQISTQLKLKDYLRMLTCKEMNLNAGKYIVLTSDKTSKGDAASSKLGQVQYAIAKVASLFSVEVLQDFKFSLITQASEPIILSNRHLIFVKGIMAGYGQSIIESGKEINLKLGDAIRHIQKDMPYLAEYSITKNVTYSDCFELEKVRQLYWQTIQHDLGNNMTSNKRLAKRARLYKDVAALTGLTAAFVGSMESSLKSKEKEEDYRREMSKLIEKVDDPNFFGYYATLGVETIVQARLWKNPDNYFIYQQTQELLQTLGQSNREQEKEGKTWLQLYIDDVTNAYAHFADSDNYSQEKDWKELTYQLKLSLYTRFPELVRKSKNSGDN
ncbi:hypothetical protein [Picosynechococcus sp. PCC 73109]|uniref:hypothetical protein n=1 Tax=Picosynechococcus sp. PCC 73109 TaxID=374982 RepID=UPI0007457E95|nr:hypothetical protein [Picosynechococcus sp. PCC 73109]AMA10851.1 hypothetical protein AWQ23_15590 [Picosynechococcus sp. PCC 73109]